MEEIEKERLKKDIAEFNKQRARKYLWGIKDKIQKHKSVRKVNQSTYLNRHNL
jgi:hypothetical protein